MVRLLTTRIVYTWLTQASRYSKLAFGSSKQAIQTDIDLLSSDFVVRSTSSKHGTRFDEIFSTSYSKLRRGHRHEEIFANKPSVQPQTTWPGLFPIANGPRTR